MNNKDNDIDYNMSEKNTDKKFITIVKKIVIVLTIIVGILGVGWSIFCIYTSFTMDSIEFFGPLLNIFSFASGIVFLIYTVIIILIIWLFYGIINLLYKFYIRLNKKHKKIFKFVFITILLIILIYSIFAKNYNYSNKNIAEVLNNPPSYEFYDNTSYYFMHNNKIYYYTLEKNSNYTELYDRLFVMNLDGTENKKLAETDELRYATFYFVYNNEAYYYTMYYNQNKKINLETGEITNVGNDDIYLAKTLNNGTVYTFVDNAIAENTYAKLKKIDIDNNKTISEIKTKYSMAGNQYYFDYDGGNIYYLEDYYSDYPSIYKNNDIIYQFTTYNRRNFPEIEFVAVNNDYIYFKQNNYIYKLNVNARTIDKVINYSLSDIKRISSGNNSDNYFYSNNKIYSFNLINDSFDLILDNIQNAPEYVYNINNKLIFTENTDNIKYYSKVDNLGTVIIYNKVTTDLEQFNKVRKASFDGNNLYLLIQNEDDYMVEVYHLD